MKIAAIVFLLLISPEVGAIAEDAKSTTQYIGVIENPPLPFSEDEKVEVRKNVRLLYAIKDGKIQAISLDKYPDKIITYYGEERLLAFATGKKELSEDNIVSVVDKIDDKLSKLVVENKNYCQWMGNCSKPLIVTTQPYTDPEKWQQVKMEMDSKIIAEVIKTIPEYDSCKAGEEESTKVQTKQADISYTEAYTNKNGASIVGFQLNPKLDTCEYVYDDSFATQWFYIKDGNVKHLGDFITPIGAGDFDNDGKSEWIFAKYAYNDDGYILFTDNFNNQLVTEWSYH